MAICMEEYGHCYVVLRTVSRSEKVICIRNVTFIGVTILNRRVVFYT